MSGTDPSWLELGYPDVKRQSVGSGYISTLALTDDQAAEAMRRRVPIGFTPPKPTEDLGECAWTARDIL